jgi:hypothetical protein
LCSPSHLQLTNVKMAEPTRKPEQHIITRKPVPKPEERGGSSQPPNGAITRRNVVQLSQKRLTTDSEIAFAWYGAPLPNLRRSDARAGNGHQKKRDPEDHQLQKVRQKASTFSFTENEDVNRSEAALEGHDPRSFANRMRNRSSTILTGKNRSPIASRTSSRRRRQEPQIVRDSYRRPLSIIDEDVSLLEGVPRTMMPSSVAIAGRRIHEIRDFNRTPSPPDDKRPPVDPSLYRDSQVRLSTFGADLGSVSGFLISADQNMPPPAPPHMREQKQPQPMRESRFYEVFSGSPLLQVEKMSQQEEKKKER